ncbi:MAG: hypothetical protein DRG11_00895 [Epsilonproteobacteria bacterium]|nr:MAG: hypothetical protein DRG11_00895 [Campylobacterota bacterium]
MRCKWCNQKLIINNTKIINNDFDIYCNACNNIVYKTTQSKTFVGILSVLSLCLYFFALFADLLDVYIFDHITSSFYSSVKFLFHSDIVSALLIFATIIVLPLFMMLLIFNINYQTNLKIPKHTTDILIKIYYKIKPWHMIEVYFIGLLLAMIKLYELSDVAILSGFYLTILYILNLYILSLVFNPLPTDFQEYKKISKNSLYKAVLFLCLAIIFIYPAYSLPMMNFSKHGVLYPTNIYEGINSFMQDGDLVVPVIIFVASIIIPAIKIVSLIFMIIMTKYNIFKGHRKLATKIYILLDFFGKYSLLDVFVVILASSYIQFNDLVNIQPGEAFVPFILVVIFTMIASKSFDTRLLWYNKP